MENAYPRDETVSNADSSLNPLSHTGRGATAFPCRLLSHQVGETLRLLWFSLVAVPASVLSADRARQPLQRLIWTAHDQLIAVAQHF